MAEPLTDGPVFVINQPSGPSSRRSSTVTGTDALDGLSMRLTEMNFNGPPKIMQNIQGARFEIINSPDYSVPVTPSNFTPQDNNTPCSTCPPSRSESPDPISASPTTTLVASHTQPNPLKPRTRSNTAGSGAFSEPGHSSQASPALSPQTSQDSTVDHPFLHPAVAQASSRHRTSSSAHYQPSALSRPASPSSMPSSSYPASPTSSIGSNPPHPRLSSSYSTPHRSPLRNRSVTGSATTSGTTTPSQFVFKKPEYNHHYHQTHYHHLEKRDSLFGDLKRLFRHSSQIGAHGRKSHHNHRHGSSPDDDTHGTSSETHTPTRQFSFANKFNEDIKEKYGKWGKFTVYCYHYWCSLCGNFFFLKKKKV